VQRAAITINVTTVWLIVERDNACPQLAE
jgi:hypothetical protein